MPLVQFQYRESPDFTIAPDDEEIKMKIRLPHKARNANWKLKEITASYFRDVPLSVRYVELDIPELLTGNHIMYSLNSEGNTKEPSRSLRFYMNRYQNDMIDTFGNNISNLRSVISHPDLDLGYHVIEELELTIHFAMFRSNADADKVSPYTFSVILEYNE